MGTRHQAVADHKYESLACPGKFPVLRGQCNKQTDYTDEHNDSANHRPPIPPLANVFFSLKIKGFHNTDGLVFADAEFPQLVVNRLTWFSPSYERASLARGLIQCYPH